MKKLFIIFLLIPVSAFADDLILSDVPNGCSNNLYHDSILNATFIPNQYQCDSGYYVPANNDGCVVCPSGYMCTGGNFYFNETLDQGIMSAYPIVEDVTKGCTTDFLPVSGILNATFTPNSHTCLPGYYLPANVDECTICPLNSICSGGTYSFNETVDQGIQSCNANNYSPTGSTVCYPHILHVGDNNIYLHSNKRTTPSVNIKIGNDIFYANMTTTPTFMNKSSIRYLRVKYNNTDYYVCDDTTCPE